MNKEAITLSWGTPGDLNEPSEKEIEEITAKMKTLAKETNVFHLYDLTAGMVAYLKTNLDKNSAVVKVVMRNGGGKGHWIIIAADKATAENKYIRI